MIKTFCKHKCFIRIIDKPCLIYKFGFTVTSERDSTVYDIMADIRAIFTQCPGEPGLCGITKKVT